jgi:hypothetical protein
MAVAPTALRWLEVNALRADRSLAKDGLAALPLLVDSATEHRSRR